MCVWSERWSSSEVFSWCWWPTGITTSIVVNAACDAVFCCTAVSATRYSLSVAALLQLYQSLLLCETDSYWLEIGCFLNKVHKNWVFLKKPSPLSFLGFCWVLGFIGFFRFFCLNEQLWSLLVDLAHQLSFSLDCPLASTLDYLKICIFIITYSS